MKLKLLGNELEKYQHGGSVAVVTDTNVAPLYLKEAEDSLSRAGFAVNSVIVKAGEESKDGMTYLVPLAGADKAHSPTLPLIWCVQNILPEKQLISAVNPGFFVFDTR